MDLIKTGKYIREQRDKLGLSQKDLSEKVHVTRQAVSNWENGKTLPDSDVLLSLSNLFHVTINDILCGNSMEETLLDLVDENNKKTHTMKKLLIVFSSMVSCLLVGFLVFYFITNYNSIRLYRVASNSKHFRIVDGIIISTSSNTYFKLGKIDVKKGEDVKVNKVKLYYKDNKKKETIFENYMNDRLYVDRVGYNEIYRKQFNKYKNHLYLEINYNDKQKEVLKLNMKEDFSNDYTMMFNESNVLKSNTPTEVQEKIVDLLKEENIQYEKNYQVRNDISTPLIQQTFTPKNDDLITNPIIEQTIEKDDSVTLEEPVKPIIETEDPVVEPTIEIEEPPIEPEINYDEIIHIIETYGEAMGKIKQLDYLVNDTNIALSYNRKYITITTMNNNTVEDIIIRNKGEIIMIYNKTVDGITNDTIEGSYDEIVITHPEIGQKVNEYLSLVYQEIK